MMPKRNVYFPKELIDEMSKHDVNWSKVCQEAVEERLKAEDTKYQKTKQYEQHSAALM
jgi:post-segregation antitoxin (ccd killing protein)